MIAMFMFGSFTTEAFVAWYFCNLFVNVCGALAVIDHHRLQTKRANHERLWALIYKMEAAVDAEWAEWSFDNCPCQYGEICSRCEEHLNQAYDQPEESKYDCHCGQHSCEVCDPDPQDRELKEEKAWEASCGLRETCPNCGAKDWGSCHCQDQTAGQEGCADDYSLVPR